MNYEELMVILNKDVTRILNKIDSLSSYSEKKEYLSAQYLKANYAELENEIGNMLEQLDSWGM